MNPRRLFTASCIALITSAFSFMIRQDISDPLGADFSLTKEQIGDVMGAAFLGMAFSMVVFAPLCDVLGMGKVLLLAWLCHLTGTLGTIFAADVAHQEFIQKAVASLAPGGWTTGRGVLWLATFLVGSGNGLVEIAINPLAATLFPTEKTHYLNVLHAWWPGGLIISGLLATFLVTPDIVGPTVFGYKLWQVKMGMLLVPLAIYGIMCLGQRFPQTERVQHNVSTGDMFLQALRPMFLLWAFCMMLTASTELGPNQWQESVLRRTANVSGTFVFVYTSGLMFVMRFFAGPLAHKLSPVGMLTCSAALSAAGLYWLSYANDPVTAFAAATVFGVGIAYFWPTMLGVTAERFPKGGALLLGLMGSVGNLAISQALPQMGAIYDSYSVNALITEAPAMQKKMVRVEKEGKSEEVPLVKTEELRSWLPEAVQQRIYPARSEKLNPDAVTAINQQAKEPNADPDVVAAKTEIARAEKEGAAWAFRWVAVLPCVLVVIFGLIAIGDKLRGGYKAVHISGKPDGSGSPPLTHSDWAGLGGPDAVKRPPGHVQR
jgi:MFS family permease